MRLQKTLCFVGIILLAASLWAQPSPGDLFREYSWHNETGDCNGALRVGGSLDYRLTENAFPYLGEGLIRPEMILDLENAVKAELVIEKMLCHAGTRGLRVSVNGHNAVTVPEPENIPEPQSSYAHHFNQVVPLDLSMLVEGSGNTFAFEVDTAEHWWPQNLLYGMMVRIYYDPSLVPGRSRIISPENGTAVGRSAVIRMGLPDPSDVRKVDLIGFYEDADLEGDGVYRKWHYGYHKELIYNHIGTISGPPFEYNWKTDWLPDQGDKMKIAAMVHRKDGFVYMTDAVEGLTLDRPGLSVELCRPFDQPGEWFTRNGEFTEKFMITGDLRKAAEAKMVFRSWSPGYFNGIYINDFLVFIKEGPKYDYFRHDIPIPLHPLQKGVNILKTGKTPLYNGEMVHGVEVQWPGIMLLVRYDLTGDPDPPYPP